MAQANSEQFCITEERGIPAARVFAWLEAQPRSEFDCQFSCEELEPRVLGAIALPRCRVTIRGQQAAVEALYHRFYLAFASAGG